MTANHPYECMLCLSERKPCRNCRTEMAAEAWRKKPAVEWDGSFPIGDWQTDRYFWFADDLLDLLDDIEDYQLTPCTPMQPPTFDLFEFASECIPECIPEGAPLPPGGDKLELAVNEWLKKLPPVWQMTGKKLCAASIRKQILGDEK